MKKIDDSVVGAIVVATGMAFVAVQLVFVGEYLAPFHGNEIVIGLILFSGLVLVGIGTAAAGGPGLRLMPPLASGLASALVATLIRSRQLAMDAGIRYVYLGNVPGHTGDYTYCPTCRRLRVERQGYPIVARLEIAAGCCRYCQTRIVGVWS